MKNLSNCFNIAVVVSRFNEEITQKLQDGAISRLNELGFTAEQIQIVNVPGAVEIPITAQRLAKTKQYEAIIALGAVIQGETKHFDYVCQQVSYGCQHIALTYDIPVVFGVLTTDTVEQAYARVGGEYGHKGQEAADTAFELVKILREI